MNRQRIQSKVALNALVAVHLVAGWVLGIFAHADRPGAGFAPFLFVGLFFAQIALVGFWATLGLSPQGSRVSWGLVTILYWMALFWVVVPGGDETMVFLLTGYAAIVILPLRALRKWVARLDRPLQHTRAGTQFQIRHLFLLTFAISLLLAVGKWVPAGSLREAGTILVLTVLIIASGSVGLAAVWAMLSKSSIWLPALLVLGYAASAGWFLDTRLAGSPNPYFMTGVFVTEITLLLVSLCIVRLCGYRLVPLTKATESLPEENGAADESASLSDTACQADPFSA